uniref:Capsid protein n=1 Tax=Steinernema glaseri TaxID=37863 RepID=A0A1I8AQY7_9BILA
MHTGAMTASEVLSQKQNPTYVSPRDGDNTMTEVYSFSLLASYPYYRSKGFRDTKHYNTLGVMSLWWCHCFDSSFGPKVAYFGFQTRHPMK